MIYDHMRQYYKSIENLKLIIKVEDTYIFEAGTIFSGSFKHFNVVIIQYNR